MLQSKGADRLSDNKLTNLVYDVNCVLFANR